MRSGNRSFARNLPVDERTKKLARGSHVPASRWRKKEGEGESGLAVEWGFGPGRGIRPKVSFSFFLFFIVSIFLSYFNFKSNQVLNSKFQIYAQEKLHMMHNFYIVFLHLFYYYIN
jgi:hypothetical protein